MGRRELSCDSVLGDKPDVSANDSLLKELRVKGHEQLAGFLNALVISALDAKSGRVAEVEESF